MMRLSDIVQISLVEILPLLSNRMEADCIISVKRTVSNLDGLMRSFMVCRKHLTLIAQFSGVIDMNSHKPRPPQQQQHHLQLQTQSMRPLLPLLASMSSIVHSRLEVLSGEIQNVIFRLRILHDKIDQYSDMNDSVADEFAGMSAMISKKRLANIERIICKGIEVVLQCSSPLVEFNIDQILQTSGISAATIIIDANNANNNSSACDDDNSMHEQKTTESDNNSGVGGVQEDFLSPASAFPGFVKEIDSNFAIPHNYTVQRRERVGDKDKDEIRQRLQGSCSIININNSSSPSALEEVAGRGRRHSSSSQNSLGVSPGTEVDENSQNSIADSFGLLDPNSSSGSSTKHISKKMRRSQEKSQEDQQELSASIDIN